MENSLAYNTVNPLLMSILTDLMQEKTFDDFILVGGTALSLRMGHRISIDIDLFTEKLYGTVDYEAIDVCLRNKYPYVDYPGPARIVGMGRSYYLGNSPKESIKLDLFYTDSFIRPHNCKGNIRIASLEDIVAMKIDVIQRTGRKKDFWDLHELLERYSPEQMIALHRERYPYTHERAIILNKFIDFEKADEDFDPVCLRGKHWETVKADFLNEIRKLSND